MIHLKTIIMKKKIDMESPVSHIIYFFLSVAGLAPFPPKKIWQGFPCVGLI